MGDHATTIDLHRVIVCAPVTYVPTGPNTGYTVGAPPEGSFDPAAVRISPVADVRPGDVVLGTIQPHYDNLLNPLDRAQWVSYFGSAPKAQQGGARPWDPRHCELCAHNGQIRQIGTKDGWVSVDGCTLYSPDMLLLVVPRELAGGEQHVEERRFIDHRNARITGWEAFQASVRDSSLRLALDAIGGS